MTTYRLVKEGNATIVRAISSAQSSGWIRPVSVDPKEYPILQWRWKISNVIQKSDVRKRSGDDYAARIFLLFPAAPTQPKSLFVSFRNKVATLLFGQYGFPQAINYVWENKTPRGTFVPSAYYPDSVVMLVVRNHQDPPNTWITEQRNFYEDYRKAFGQDPPRLAGCAILTDTDNTRESVTAYYGDILVKKK